MGDEEIELIAAFSAWIQVANGHNDGMLLWLHRHTSRTVAAYADSHARRRHRIVREMLGQYEASAWKKMIW